MVGLLQPMIFARAKGYAEAPLSVAYPAVALARCGTRIAGFR